MRNSYDFTKLSDSFQALVDNKGLMFQMLDMFPIPIEVFAPNGTSVFLNRAMLDMNNIPDANLVVGKYNLVNDPICNDQMGLREPIQKAFRGETIALSDFSAPIQDLVDRGITSEKPFEMAFMDLYLFPIWNGEQLAYVVNIFILKSMYQGRPDVAKAKAYIDSHWLDEFDSNDVAKAANISHAHLRALFKQHTGMTMHDYHKKVKVDHIKEKLADRSLSISEAFSFCGEGSRGTFARIFKDLTGMTPKEYRNSLK